MAKNITNGFLEKIKRANEEFCLLEKGQKILVGLSGGADSVCLLLSLCNLKEEYDLEIYALHVNHMIRGRQADRDEEFCRNLCEKLGINFMSERINIPEIAKKLCQSIELAARNERYNAYIRTCKKYDIHVTATAHNANDNTETTLFNLVRGAGTRGLCGIPAKRSLTDDVVVVRPLINVTRDEIEEYLAQNNQSFVTDSTNLETEYTRNYLRHEIVPKLYKVNSDLHSSISRTNRLHAMDEDYLTGVARQCLTDDALHLSKLHEAILSRVLIEMFNRVSSETLNEYHVKSLCEIIYRAEDTKLSLPDCYMAIIYHGRLKFVKDNRRKKEEAADFELILNEKATFFENSVYALYISFDQSETIPKKLINDQNIYKIYTTDYLYFDTIPKCLACRNRRAGDRIYSGRMHKSLKRLLNLSEFDGGERKTLPIVTHNQKIILIPGVAVDDEYKKGKANKTKVSFSLYIKE